MKRENTHVLPTSMLDGTEQNSSHGKKYGWKLFAAQLWLMVAFVAMCLVAMAAKSLIVGDEPRAVSAVLGVAGVALFPLAWRNVARVLDAADGPGLGTPLAVKARLAQQLALAAHR